MWKYSWAISCSAETLTCLHVLCDFLFLHFLPIFASRKSLLTSLTNFEECLSALYYGHCITLSWLCSWKTYMFLLGTTWPEITEKKGPWEWWTTARTSRRCMHATSSQPAFPSAAKTAQRALSIQIKSLKMPQQLPDNRYSEKYCMWWQISWYSIISHIGLISSHNTEAICVASILALITMSPILVPPESFQSAWLFPQLGKQST